MTRQRYINFTSYKNPLSALFTRNSPRIKQLKVLESKYTF